MSVKTTIVGVVSLVAVVANADAMAMDGSPTVVRNAAMREAKRQDTTWTSENIQANPYLFLMDQIAMCDKLKAKIEAQNITLVRMGKQASRTAEDAQAMTVRYEKFLAAAKAAYKAAEADGKWPVTVNGYELDEEELCERIADALERVELAKKEFEDGMAIAKKIELRKGTLKAKKREVMTLRRRLVQQAEQVKMNAALAELGQLNDMLGAIEDLMIEIDEDPTKLSLDDLTAESPSDKRSKAVRAFLDN